MPQRTDYYLKQYSDTEEELTVFVVGTGYSLKLPDGSRESVVYFGMVKDSVFSKERGMLDWIRHNGLLFKGKNYHFDKYGIYRVRASRQEPAAGLPRWLVRDVLAKDVQDTDLLAWKEHYLTPKVIERQGVELTLNRDFGQYEGYLSKDGYECNVYLETADRGDEDVGRAGELYDDIVSRLAWWDEQARQYAAEKLLETANDWRDEEDPELTADDFTRRMTLTGFSVSSKGTLGLYSFFYSDDEMFAGHEIFCEGDTEHGFTDSSIQG
ncbi:MAG: DUF2262 domain-containing protein [Solobacterium sp.]|nr:DUF2262 domain-containing protein [Solobacterium sp.]